MCSILLNVTRCPVKSTPKIPDRDVSHSCSGEKGLKPYSAFLTLENRLPLYRATNIYQQRFNLLSRVTLFSQINKVRAPNIALQRTFLARLVPKFYNLLIFSDFYIMELMFCN